MASEAVDPSALCAQTDCAHIDSDLGGRREVSMIGQSYGRRILAHYAMPLGSSGGAFRQTWRLAELTQSSTDITNHTLWRTWIMSAHASNYLPRT